MLPKNALRDTRMARLKVFRGEENPYEANIVKEYEYPTADAKTSSQDAKN